MIISLLRGGGFLILMLVIYHYINEPIGLSLSGSIAVSAFAICLIELFPEYKPDGRVWFGWGLISIACLIVAMADTLNWMPAIALLIFIFGYRLACLPFNLGASSGTDNSSDFGGFDGGGCDGGDGGGC